MLPFETLKKSATRLKQGGINLLVKDLIRANAGLILKMNKNDQLFNDGINRLSHKLKEYTEFTKKIKRSKGQPVDRTTLRDTGSFHKRFFLSVDNQGFEIDSTDPKRDELVEKYQDDIFGLTDENMRILQNVLKQQLLTEIRKRI
jgi:hypothetical protein